MCALNNRIKDFNDEYALSMRSEHAQIATEVNDKYRTNDRIITEMTFK